VRNILDTIFVNEGVTNIGGACLKHSAGILSGPGDL
jgi:hypothetical protein